MPGRGYTTRSHADVLPLRRPERAGVTMPPPMVRAGDDRYQTFVRLSAAAIARWELDPPLAQASPEDEQVAHLLRHGRIAECNEVFAGLFGRQARELRGLTIGEVVPADDPARLQRIRDFVRSG